MKTEDELLALVREKWPGCDVKVPPNFYALTGWYVDIYREGNLIHSFYAYKRRAALEAALEAEV